MYHHGVATISDDIEKNQVENAVAAFVARRRAPAHLRDQVDLSLEEAVAKARYFKSRDEWAVYWKRADGKWHGYDPAAHVKTIQAFLTLVDDDEYGCFFG